MIAQKKFLREPEPRPRVPVILQVAGIYFFIVLALIALIEVFAIPLEENLSGRPSPWLGTIQFLYYFFPSCLAVIFGALFRPAILTTTRILIFLLLIQFAVSLLGMGLRETYRYQRQADVRRSHLAVVRFDNFRHKFTDQNTDGRVDRAEFFGNITVEKLPAGEYQLSLMARQNNAVFAPNPILVLKQIIPKEETKSYRLKFAFDPQLFATAFSHGPVDLYFSVQRIMRPDERIRRLVRFNRWIPFLRTTSWNGEDPLLGEQIIDLDVEAKVDDLYLLPLDR